MSTWYPKGTSTTLGVMHETASPEAEFLEVTAPHREFLDQVLDKWSLQVMDVLCEKPLRFNELRRAIPTVGQKSLTATLRRLERNGMVERVVLATRPVAVEYRIAPLGRNIQDLVDALLRWTTINMPDVEKARERFDSEE
jgi:DNA-binding HxlR family transcriptional regulator